MIAVIVVAATAVAVIVTAAAAMHVQPAGLARLVTASTHLTWRSSAIRQATSLVVLQ